MRYEIKGAPFPTVICYMENGEQIVTEGGGMSWMSPNMEMQTTSNGGVGKALGRMFSGESMFQNIYTSVGGPGMISIGSSFPGEIKAIEVKPGEEIICQKSAFLASTPGVNMSIHFKKKFSTGFFGGEGFIMQKFSGNGLLFIEIDGTPIEYDLQEGQQMLIDTGHLVMMSSTCKMDIKSVAGLKNKLLGGEGFFNTVVEGPGKIIIQTMPVSKLAGTLARYIPMAKS